MSDSNNQALLLLNRVVDFMTNERHYKIQCELSKSELDEAFEFVSQRFQALGKPYSSSPNHSFKQIYCGGGVSPEASGKYDSLKIQSYCQFIFGPRIRVMIDYEVFLDGIVYDLNSLKEFVELAFPLPRRNDAVSDEKS